MTTAAQGQPDSEPAMTPAEWPARLTALLASAADADGRLSDAVSLADLARYIATGEPAGLPATLGQHAALSKLLLENTTTTWPRVLDPVYAQIGIAEPAMLVRWGQIVAAALDNAYYWKGALRLSAAWPEALIHQVIGWSRLWPERPLSKHVTSAVFENALAAGGLEPSALVVAAFATPLEHSRHTESCAKSVGAFRDFGAAALRYADRILPHLAPADAAQRLHVLTLLAPLTAEALKPFAAPLAELASASSKQVSSLAQGLAWRVIDDTLPALREIARSAKPDQRQQALRFLDDIARRRGDADLRAFARDTASADKATSIQALLSEWDARESTTEQGPVNAYTVPQIEWSVPGGAALDALLDTFWREVGDAIETANARVTQDALRAPPVTAQTREALRDYLVSSEPIPTTTAKLHHIAEKALHGALERLPERDGASSVLLLKLYRFFGLLVNASGWLNYHSTNVIEALRRRTGQPAMLEYALMLSGLGLTTDKLLYSFGHVREKLRPGERSADDLWPFFAHYLNTLSHELKWNVQNYPTADHSARFRAIGLLPQVPPELVSWLLEVALTGPKAQRGPARAVLARLPQRDSHVIAALSDGKADVRAAAAAWIRDLALEAAVPALEKAAKTEKQEAAKGALLEALIALGRSTAPFVDRKALAREAEKAWSKGAGTDLEWFDWDALPPVVWADTAQPVEPVLIRGMVVQAVKQKTPEPHALLRQYCAMFEPRSREALGQHLLEAWIAADTRPISEDLAKRSAQQSARSTHQFIAQNPQYYTGSPQLNYTVEQLYESLLAKYLKQPEGTAIASKGILALAAACAGERAVPVVARYLKDYYGTRAAHSKALIAMLAWIPHPAAVQLLLAVGNRFRTKGIQEEAANQVEALADRRGWTVAELADRTIPAAGFDETGTLTLSYGDREFVARLMPDFTIQLQDENGKKLSALPDPRKDDDETLAKESKKSWSEAKKTVRTTLAQQTDRFLEALCTQREWPYEDWNRYLLQHPIARHLVESLIWAVVEGGEVKTTFRPLGDGSLTDVDDNPVSVADTAKVRIAHEFILDAELAGRWQRHLSDYKVMPLFPLFGRGVYRLPAELQQARELKDFEGCVLPNFTLRSRAQKLGYARANNGESWFTDYQRAFRSLGITAVIEFSGSSFPEENKPVALISLKFERVDGDSREQLTLGEVPGLLLSECYQDLRQLAAESKGFDPDWAAKCRV
ncbi:MAG TPA: DUF4132 domain-containing protein [Tahibacter sp.]|uniref:DUF4132 domain-containing protein n=1 Tax=Tahibacter sp. TaxID=2056211 RepID=UPI002CD2BD6E|nr:DUF4132 domain-containing protein [Tahibacter sp.]HSX62300.1 DUF4132 domain-containing protein [Tahibacter sp.]